MVLKGRCVGVSFTDVNALKQLRRDLVSTRIYPRISVYLSEGFVSLVHTGCYQSSSRSLQRPLRAPVEVKGDTTLSLTGDSSQYLRIQR
jgi:hypothetical protein